ncbi:hypothetical protein KI387_014945 [Taxus chinensis]|uniref:Uncharacterized protein n=1 Tax=Taxus chinensis TaxID=29808 RepID=A0AA38CP47_TAXCH|nr:hypothetical protein KI387_014945 [Taxus chinensis]
MIRFHGFKGESFMLPSILTARIVGLEIMRQSVVLDMEFGSGRKKKALYDLSISKGGIIVQKRWVDHTLFQKLASYGFGVIKDAWRFDPVGSMATYLSTNKISDSCKHEPRPFFDSRRSPQDELSDVFVELMDIPAPRWEKSHQAKYKFDPNLAMPKGLRTVLKKSGWSGDKMKAFWKYRQEIGQLTRSFEFVPSDEVWEEKWDVEHDSDSTSEEVEEVVAFQWQSKSPVTSCGLPCQWVLPSPRPAAAKESVQEELSFSPPCKKLKSVDISVVSEPSPLSLVGAPIQALPPSPPSLSPVRTPFEAAPYVSLPGFSTPPGASFLSPFVSAIPSFSPRVIIPSSSDLVTVASQAPVTIPYGLTPENKAEKERNGNNSGEAGSVII